MWFGGQAHRLATPAGRLDSGRPTALGRARLAAERRAVEWSARPAQALARLLAAGAAVAAIGIPLGLLIVDDQAAVFREGMPGTWLSFAVLLAIAATASATHRALPDRRRWHETFWGLAAVVFAVLAFVEIAQPTVFVAHWLRDEVHVATPLGLSDLDAAILSGLFVLVATALLVRARPLLRLPRALALMAVGGALGVASQSLDALVPATQWEFVAEESLKLAALPFMLAGFLVALAAATPRTPDA